MKTIKRIETYNAEPEKVFETIDDLGVTGMHMTQSSAMMMGSKLHLKYLTDNPKGLGSKYRWTGKMMGMKMDFTVEVTKWVNGVEKVWETIGKAKMIIYSWYRMHLLLSVKNDKTIAELSITYKKPKGLFAKLVSFLFADWYCNWCLKNMLKDTKEQLKDPKNVEEHHDHASHDGHSMHSEHVMDKSSSGHQHNANPAHGHESHDHHKMMIADFKKRFYVVLVLTIPIMLLSEMIQNWLNIHIVFAGSQYILLLLSSIVFFYGGWPFLKGLIDEMKRWKPGMMTLIGFAISVAYIYSVATIFGLKGMD